MELSYIPLSDLKISPRNPRKVRPENPKLELSIAKLGLINPLIIEKNGKGYDVLAGGTRLECMKRLHESNKQIPRLDYKDGEPMVPCIEETANGDIIAFVDNDNRTHMHPADLYRAISNLRKEGIEDQDICDAIGVTLTRFNQLTRLGDVHPKILQAYREGKIDDNTCRAFTLTSDKKRQLALFEELGDRVYAHAVRNHFRSNGMDLSHAIFPIEEYKGTIIEDLFQDQRWAEDTPRFLALQRKACEAKVEQYLADGWSVSKVIEAGEWSEIPRGQTIVPHYNAEYRKIVDKVEKLNAKAQDAKTEKMAFKYEAEADELIEWLEEHEDDEAYFIWDDSQKEKGMAYMVLRTDTGEAFPLFFFVPKEQKPDTNQTADDTGTTEPEEKPAITKSLALDLNLMRDAIVRGALFDSGNKEIALRVVLAQILSTGGNIGFRSQVNTVAVRQNTEREISDTVSPHFMLIKDALDALQNKSTEEMLAMLVPLAAHSLGADPYASSNWPATGAAAELVAYAGQALEVDVRNHWRPDEDYFTKLRKDQLDELAASLGESVGNICGRLKKTEAVRMLTELFDDTGKAVKKHGIPMKVSDLKEKIDVWEPEGMGF